MRWLFQREAATAIPENLIKEMVDLGSMIVVIIERNGKVQKPWFKKNLVMGSTIRVRCERSSGRIPAPNSQKLSEDTLEIGIHSPQV